MIVKIILSISILLSPVEVLNVDEPSICEICPGTNCNNL